MAFEITAAERLMAPVARREATEESIYLFESIKNFRNERPRILELNKQMATEVDVDTANRDLEDQIETLRQKIRVEIELANFYRKQALECVTTERFFYAKEGGFIKGLP